MEIKEIILTRILMLLYGFGVSWFFTGELITSLKIFTALAIGNTLIMFFIWKS